MTQSNRLQDPKYYQRFQSVTRYHEGQLIDSMLRIRKLHEFRYEFTMIKNILEAFNSEENYEVNSLYLTIHYRDLFLQSTHLLPRQEKEYHFQEKALANSGPSSESKGAVKEVTRASGTRIPKPTLTKSLLY